MSTEGARMSTEGARMSAAVPIIPDSPTPRIEPMVVNMAPGRPAAATPGTPFFDFVPAWLPMSSVVSNPHFGK